MKTLMEKYKSLGMLGLCDKFLIRISKIFFWIWYARRFSKVGRSVTFEGAIGVVGGRGITLGDNIVFGKNVRLYCAVGARLIIGDNCYIADNVSLASKGDLEISGGTKIHEGSIVGGKKIKVGKNVWISRFCTVEGMDVAIGDNSILSPFVFIIDTDHYVDKETGEITMDVGDSGPIKIGQNAWVCNGSKVLKGVSIGRRSIVAAGSVVTRDVEDLTIVAGTPARVIKKTIG